MRNLMQQLVHQDEGQDLIEYALLAGFISLAAVLAIIAVGTALGTLYGKVEGQVNAAGG